MAQKWDFQGKAKEKGGKGKPPLATSTNCI